MFINNKNQVILFIIIYICGCFKLFSVTQESDLASSLQEQQTRYKKASLKAKKSIKLANLFNKAEIAYQAGNLENSFKNYEKILAIDPENTAARLGMELIDRKKEITTTIIAREKKYNMIEQVNNAWELPPQKNNIFSSNLTTQTSSQDQKTRTIAEKTQKIIIPKIDFFELPLFEAINEIKKMASLLDASETDSNKKGVNIVLQINSLNAANEKKITLSLTDLPLKEALNYIAKQADLVLRIEPYAIVLIPQQDFQEQLITKEYKIPSDAMDSWDQLKKLNNNNKTNYHSINKELTIKDFLISQGVTFPPGAFLYHLQPNNTLIVKNTQSNLDFIESILTPSFDHKTAQIEIETRFLEVKQENLNEHGLDWLMGSFQFTTGSGITNNIISSDRKTQQGSPFATTSSQNTINTALLGTPYPASKEVLALAGILTNPQFQVILKALNQQKGVNLLSAPKVTVSSGQRAVINVSREFPYPADYTPPQIPQSQGSGINPAIPATPSSFKKRNIGVQLEVEPLIRADNTSIELTLYPQLVDFKGFVNYGAPIYSQAPTFFAGQTNAVLSTQQVLLTQNTINQPIFSVRQVTTDVLLNDGQTVVLGGLMREDLQKIYNKVPILGNIPFLGVLFHSSSKQKVKQNLIIFVTVHLIK